MVVVEVRKRRGLVEVVATLYWLQAVVVHTVAFNETVVSTVGLRLWLVVVALDRWTLSIRVCRWQRVQRFICETVQVLREGSEAPNVVINLIDVVVVISRGRRLCRIYWTRRITADTLPEHVSIIQARDYGRQFAIAFWILLLFFSQLQVDDLQPSASISQQSLSFLHNSWILDEILQLVHIFSWLKFHFRINWNSHQIVVLLQRQCEHAVHFDATQQSKLWHEGLLEAFWRWAEH